MMTRYDRDRLTRIVESWGADPRRWPADARARLAEAPAEALARAASLDRLLDADAASDAPLPPLLRARILAAAPQSLDRRFGAGFVPLRQWARAAVVAGALMTGAAAGYAGTATVFAGVAQEQALLDISLGAPDDPFAAFREDVI